MFDLIHKSHGHDDEVSLCLKLPLPGSKGIWGGRSEGLFGERKRLGKREAELGKAQGDVLKRDANSHLSEDTWSY